MEDLKKFIKDELTKGFKDVNIRFDAVDKRFDAVDKRFDAVDKRFDAVDKRFEAVDKRFEEQDSLTIKRIKNSEETILNKMDIIARRLTDDIASTRDYLENKISQTNERLGELQLPIMNLQGSYADAMGEIEDCKIENLAITTRVERLEAQAT